MGVLRQRARVYLIRACRDSRERIRDGEAAVVVAMPVDPNLFARGLHDFFDGEFHQVVGAARRGMADRIAQDDCARPRTDRCRIERDDRGRIGANRVFRHVHDRQARVGGEAHGFVRGALQVIDGPILDEAADRARTEKHRGFDRPAHALADVDHRLDVLLMGAAAHIRANLHARTDDLPREGFGIGKRTRPRARQADIDQVDAKRFHQMQDFDFFADRGIAHRRILQAVAQRFVVEHHAPPARDFGLGVCVPVVDEIVVHMRSRRKTTPQLPRSAAMRRFQLGANNASTKRSAAAANSAL